MRNFLPMVAAAAMAFTAVPAAAAVHFAGSYNVSPFTDGDHGLAVNISKLAPVNLNFDLADVGSTHERDLFKIWTNESSVNPGEDTIARDISVQFNFTDPEIFGGPLGGSTVGEFQLFGIFQNGEVTWEDAFLDFNGGQLQIHLDDATFNEGIFGLDEGKRNGANIHATFTMLAAAPGTAVPEPATWALLIGGFGLTGVALRRRRTATFA